MRFRGFGIPFGEFDDVLGLFLGDFDVILFGGRSTLSGSLLE
jgi:hypothetical protein